MKTLSHSTPITIGLTCAVVGAAFWLGSLSNEVRGLSAGQKEHARLIAEASATLAAVQARLEERKP